MSNTCYRSDELWSPQIVRSFSRMCSQAKRFTNSCTFQSSRPYLFDLMKSGAGHPDGWGGNLSQTGEHIQPRNHSRHQLHVFSARVRRNLPCWAGWQQWCCSSGSAALLFGTPGSCRCNDNHTQTSGQTHGSRKRASQLKDGRSTAKMYGWWTVVENLKPFIMGALLDLLRCPSLWTSDDGISRSSSIFSWGITPELFMVWSCLRQDAKWGSVWGITSSPFFSQHGASSARHVLKRDEWSGAEREQRATNYC